MLQCPTCESEMRLIGPGHWRCDWCSQPDWMTAVIQRLRQHAINKHRLRVVEERLAAMTDMAAARIGSGGGGGLGDPTGSRASNIVALETEARNLRLDIAEIERALDALDAPERTIVERQHVYGEPPGRIAAQMCLSTRSYYRIRREALARMAEVLGYSVTQTA